MALRGIDVGDARGGIGGEVEGGGGAGERDAAKERRERAHGGRVEGEPGTDIIEETDAFAEDLPPGVEEGRAVLAENLLESARREERRHVRLEERRGTEQRDVHRLVLNSSLQLRRHVQRLGRRELLRSNRLGEKVRDRGGNTNK